MISTGIAITEGMKSIMKNITIEDILKATNGILINGEKKLVCKNFSKDTRIIQENDTYIGIKGENFDGNKFWKEALLAGAQCVIVENIEFNEEDIEKFKEKTIVKVENTLEALYQIARLKRDLYNIKKMNT